MQQTELNNTRTDMPMVLQLPVKGRDCDFADLGEWLKGRREQIGVMMAAHARITEAFGQLAE